MHPLPHPRRAERWRNATIDAIGGLMALLMALTFAVFILAGIASVLGLIDL